MTGMDRMRAGFIPDKPRLADVPLDFVVAVVDRNRITCAKLGPAKSVAVQLPLTWL
jgi:hypothetical protein